MKNTETLDKTISS